ncbi:PAAR domain-containing protein [Streptomyces sp. BA2]|uniref:PAAR domain-containing protein n=1 Tax=Streptomyces sp. BA2 TaxID=436595 RepID=UPI00132ADE65|nr:PAAR domain-containing protein [Streptomyces sp. BA2]MWA07836.1 PaaR repeat-containing protein [Streptomyces sp. BA2]
MPPAARIGDALSHLPNPTPVPLPSGDGVIAPPGALSVLIGGLPAAVAGSPGACAFPGHPPVPPAPLIPTPMAGKTVLIGDLPALRMGDKGPCGTVIVGGAPTVCIGG